MDVIFKIIRAEGGCNAFIIADAGSRKACIIDPRADQQDLYEEFLGSRKLTAAFVIDSHTHADHYSGSHLVARNLGARIAMSVSTASARADFKLTDKQVIELGSSLAIEVLATPGHTPDSISLVAKGAWGQAAFTGDTLFIGGSGRTDFPGADAGAQYDSLHGKLGMLNDQTWIFPGHDYSDLLFSNIGHEKRTNPHLLITSRDEFIRMKDAEALESGVALPQVITFNLSASPRSFPRSGVQTMCATACAKPATPLARKSPTEWRELMGGSGDRSSLFIDIREPEEFARGHVEGMRNLPMSELPLHWNELISADKVYISCDRGLRSRYVADTLNRLGMTNVADLEGGYIAWVTAGLPVKK